MFEYDLYLLCNIYMNYANSCTVYLYTYIYICICDGRTYIALLLFNVIHMYACMYISIKRNFNVSISHERLKCIT